jgi:hypothetical protein
MNLANPTNPSNESGHEVSDVNVSGVVVFIVVLIVAGVIISGAVWALYRYFEQSALSPAAVQYPLAESSMRRLPPEPRLQTDPREDLIHLRNLQDDVLTSYAWVDRNGGIVRIPIERAMELTAERGLPTR